MKKIIVFSVVVAILLSKFAYAKSLQLDLEQGYNSFEDTSFFDGSYIPLYIQNDRKVEISYPVLVGEWMYYLKWVSYGNESDGYREEEASICRCRATDLSGEELLCKTSWIGNIKGLRDIGDGLLLWYSDLEPEGLNQDDIVGRSTMLRFMRMDYDGSNLSQFAEQRVNGISYTYIDCLTIAGRTIWYSWENAASIGDAEYNGAIYELSLDDPRPRLLLSGKWHVYQLAYAYGKLFCEAEMKGGSRINIIDPITTEYRTLLLNKKNYYTNFCIMNYRLYCWNGDQKVTVSMNLDGSDIKTICKERFNFLQTWNGCVSVVKVNKTGKTILGYYVFYPSSKKDFLFDADIKRSRIINRDDFILGDIMYLHEGKKLIASSLECP